VKEKKDKEYSCLERLNPKIKSHCLKFLLNLYVFPEFFVFFCFCFLFFIFFFFLIFMISSLNYYRLIVLSLLLM
jgi:hypothetical protein